MISIHLKIKCLINGVSLLSLDGKDVMGRARQYFIQPGYYGIKCLQILLLNKSPLLFKWMLVEFGFNIHSEENFSSNLPKNKWIVTKSCIHLVKKSHIPYSVEVYASSIIRIGDS